MVLEMVRWLASSCWLMPTAQGVQEDHGDVAHRRLHRGCERMHVWCECNPHLPSHTLMCLHRAACRHSSSARMQL